jgi:hypothetical protein
MKDVRNEIENESAPTVDREQELLKRELELLRREQELEKKTTKQKSLPQPTNNE